MAGARAPEAIRILLADDHRLYVAAMEAALACTDGIEVVGVAFDGAEAARLAEELQPDVVLMDIEMPVVDGIEATRQICETNSSTRVLMLTSSDSEADFLRAHSAGAVGFIRKDRSAAQMMEAMPTVSALLATFGGVSGSS